MLARRRRRVKSDDKVTESQSHEVDMTLSQWLNIAGLVADAIGAVFIVWGLFISVPKANRLSAPIFADDEATTKEDLNPIGRDRIRQSHNAKIGLAFLLIGFGLQIVATVARP